MKALLKSLGLSTFVAFDLETTGLNVDEDDIIEFGAVKYVDGKEDDSIDLLIKPSKKIPPEIEQLTGITNQMVGRSPGIRKQTQNILDFIEDHPLVAHNITFDYEFLSRKLPGAELKNELYDTLTLCRIFFFYLPEFRLGPLMEQFGVSRRGSHRANTDAENVAFLFMKAIERMQEYDLETFQTFNRILRETNVPNKKLFIEFANYYIRTKQLGKSRKHLKNIWESPKNVTGNRISDILEKTETAIPKESISQIFSENSELASRLPKYEKRDEQIRMAEAILESLKNQEIAVVEAGTGVGKSLGYLIPLIINLYSEGGEEKAVVSSNTKNLQEQLFYKEIPFIQEELGWQFKAVMLKGRNNYICLTRWQWLLSNIERVLSPWERNKILPIVIWLQHTKTGDISECRGFNQEYSSRIWSRICSEQGYCTTQVCRKNHFCFLGKIRAEAYGADIVVINHSLLMANATSDKKALPPFQYLVVDEGHNLEKNAYQYFAQEWNYWKVHQILSTLYNPGKSPSGKLLDLHNYFKSAGDNTDIQNILELAMQKTETLLELNNTIFTRIGNTIKGADDNFAYVFKKRFKQGHSPLKEYEQDLFEYLDLMADCEKLLRNLVEKIIEYGQQDLFKEKEETTNDLRNIADNLAQTSGVLQELLDCRRNDLIYWYEISKEKERNVYFYYTPLNVGDLVYDLIYKDIKSLVLTSATLKIADSFEYIYSRIGLSHFDPDRINFYDFGSPFDYNQQAYFATIEHHLDPNSQKYSEVLAELISGIANEQRRGTLVLFTSYKLLTDTYKKAEEIFHGDVKFLRQTRAVSRHDLLEIFKKDKSSILFGTDSFWEGIDVIGDSLEVLIITKLPFAVPSEPVIEANVEKMRKEGKNPFNEYQVPEAILKFRQGFGRLIRSRTDKGVIICLDSRIIMKKYGKMFQKSVPVTLTSHKTVRDLLREIELFL